MNTMKWVLMDNGRKVLDSCYQVVNNSQKLKENTDYLTDSRISGKSNKITQR